MIVIGFFVLVSLYDVENGLVLVSILFIKVYKQVKRAATWARSSYNNLTCPIDHTSFWCRTSESVDICYVYLLFLPYPIISRTSRDFDIFACPEDIKNIFSLLWFWKKQHFLSTLILKTTTFSLYSDLKNNIFSLLWFCYYLFFY